MDKSKFTADRVKILLEAPVPTPQNRGKWHSYKHKKTLRIPVGLEKPPLENSPASKKRFGKAKVILQRSPKSPIEQMNCTPNQNYPLFFIEKSEALLSRKIESFRAKERFIAMQNIKRLSHEMQQWIYSQIHQEVKVCKKEPLEFYNLLEKREERHFRIDRIIKYLSDT